MTLAQQDNLLLDEIPAVIGEANMIQQISFLLLAVLSLCAPVLASDDDSPPESGALVIVGGGGIPAAIAAEALRLARGHQSRVVVVPLASSRPEAGPEQRQYWLDQGASDVRVLDLDDPNAARAALLSADLVWLGGGSQQRLVERLEEAQLVTLLRTVHESGAVIAGTSAGAAAQSEVMITGKASLDRIVAGATETVDGLGLWPEAIVDQHFHRRKRFNRLLSAVLDNPKLIGVGIDERTAVILKEGTIEVAGEGSVLVIDARSANLPSPKSKSGSLHAATDLRIHVLTEGMSWKFREP